MQATGSAQPGPAIAQNITGSPTAVWRAYQAQRDELTNQLERLTDNRRSLSSQLTEDGVSGANKAGIEARIGELDKQIANVEKQLSTANQSVAQAAAIPGAVQLPPAPIRQGPPEEAWVVGTVFILVVFLPISIAFARRIWKRSSTAIAQLPSEIMDRLTRLDQAVDSIAVEVERIGEGQRFVTRVMSERGHAIGAGPAQPVDIAAAERLRVGERKA